MLFRKHHLQYIPVSESFMQVGLKKNNRNRKLLSMKCVVVSFHLGYNLVGLSLKIKPVKKSAFNNWSNNGFLLSVTRRVCFLMICIFKNLAIASNAGVYFVQSSFSQASVLVNRNRAGIASISSSHLHILSFGMLV